MLRRSQRSSVDATYILMSWKMMRPKPAVASAGSVHRVAEHQTHPSAHPVSYADHLSICAASQASTLALLGVTVSEREDMEASHGQGASIGAKPRRSADSI